MKLFEKVIETEHATFRLARGVIWHIWKPVPLTYDGALAIGHALKTLANGKKLPVIVDGRYAAVPTGKIKAYFSSAEYNEPMFCIAAVMPSHATYIAAKLFQNFFASPIPMKIVRTEVEAFDWFRNIGLKLVANSILDSSEDFHRDPNSHLSKKLVGVIERYAVGDYSDFDTEEFASDQTIFYFANALQILGGAVQLQLDRYRELNEQLDLKVIERTKELDESRLTLIEQARMVSVGRFASNLSHEINNPLSVIYASARLLIKQLENGTQDLTQCRSKLEHICKMSERISGIVKTVKLLGHDGRNDPKFLESFDGILKETLDLLSVPFLEAKIQLHIEVSKGVQLECRRGEIIQVLVNLLKNALESFNETKNNDRWIKIGGRVIDEEFVVEISNNGELIPVEIQSKIMDPFYTTKKFGHGTGLGLSLCRSIINFHGGDLKLITEEHTLFRFNISLTSLEQKI